MIRLALAYMRDRPLGVVLNALLLAIAVATLVLLLQFAQQAGERFERDARGIDLVVGAKGSPLQLVLSSVYHIDVPTGNIPLGELDRLRADPGVACRSSASTSSSRGTWSGSSATTSTSRTSSI